LAKICIKIRHFYWKIAKIAQRWGRPPCLRQAANPPDPYLHSEILATPLVITNSTHCWSTPYCNGQRFGNYSIYNTKLL